MSSSGVTWTNAACVGAGNRKKLARPNCLRLNSVRGNRGASLFSHSPTSLLHSAAALGLGNEGLREKGEVDLFRRKRRRARKNEWLLSMEAEAADVSSSSGDAQESYPEEDELPNPNKVFPRLKEKDPYKLLGIGADASYEEVQEARVYLVEEYKGHKMSVEAIDIAHDKIISQNFKERKQDGIRITSKAGKKVAPPVDDEPEGPFSKFLDTRVARKALLKTVGVFLTVIVWTVATALDSEPTAQVTTGLIACIFFVQQKRQKKADKEENVFWGSVGTAIVATAAGWIAGNAVPVVLPVFPEGVSVQAICTIFALIAQWFASTYAK